ncbi:unnamed protein product, partial [Candidula unifasciata]
VLQKFKVKLNDVANSCVKERRYTISPTIVDVSCDTTVLVKVLTLEGLVAPHVCTIYVSAGRNIALKQRAQQTSTATPMELNKATNAVDGRKEANNNLGYCSHTEQGLRSQEWNVTLAHPSVLYRILVYSSEDDREITGGFTLSTHSSSGNLIEIWRSSAAKDATFEPYDFILLSHLPTQTVKIKGGYGMALSMCEVFVFGEYVCPDLHHGLSCQKRCQCKGHEVCNVATGKCAPGCPVGYYGFQCGLVCNSSCHEDPCLQVSGQCYRCPPGYKGDGCNDDCNSGTYGESCEQICSEFCINECDPIDGYCECSTGYRQPKCTECSQGTYGSQCAMNCSSNCLNRRCHHITGRCGACRGTHIGHNCE